MYKNDRRVNLRVSDIVYNLLSKQADEKGMNLSAYLSHLVILENERMKNFERMDKIFTQMLPNGINDIAKLAQLINNKEGVK